MSNPIPRPPEYVYLITNPSMPGLVKIGKTNDLVRRLAELNNTSVPTPFTLDHYFEVRGGGIAYQVEQATHAALAAHRLNNGREFFSVTLAQAFGAVEQVLRDRFPGEYARHEARTAAAQAAQREAAQREAARQAAAAAAAAAAQREAARIEAARQAAAAAERARHDAAAAAAAKNKAARQAEVRDEWFGRVICAAIWAVIAGAGSFLIDSKTPVLNLFAGFLGAFFGGFFSPFFYGCILWGIDAYKNGKGAVFSLAVAVAPFAFTLLFFLLIIKTR